MQRKQRRMDRKLSEQLAMYDGEDVGVYDVFDTINIQLASTITDELEPITVEWSLVNFDGGSASIQMHIEKLYE